MSETGEAYGTPSSKFRVPSSKFRVLGTEFQYSGSEFGAWNHAADWLPGTQRVVLATDGEGFFLAYWDDDRQRWYDSADDLEVDSVIQGWMELPAIPDY